MPSAKARTARNKRERSPVNVQTGTALSKMTLGMRDPSKLVEALQLSKHGRQKFIRSRGRWNPLLGLQNLGADVYTARSPHYLPAAPNTLVM